MYVSKNTITVRTITRDTPAVACGMLTVRGAGRIQVSLLAQRLLILVLFKTVLNLFGRPILNLVIFNCIYSA